MSRWAGAARGPAAGPIALFLLFWLFIGFATGTALLLGPVRSWARYCREQGLGQQTESAGVIAIIALLVAASAWLAFLATGAFRRGPLVLRVMLLGGCSAAATSAYLLWMNPETLRSSMAAEQQTAGGHFTIGPYPDQQRLIRLKNEGYTAVISLLHPAVVPFEPQLLARERLAAARAGIELVHAPMLPWVSQNAEALEQIRRLAALGQGRYYVHCYLGTDRVNVVRRIVEGAASGRVTVESQGKRRPLRRRSAFERGPLVWVEDDVVIGPHPTETEFFTYVVSGQFAQVVALLDPADDDSRGWVEAEKRLFKKYSMPFLVIDASNRPYDPAQVLEAVRTVQGLRRPVFVYHFLWRGRSSWADAFVLTWRSGIPPLPPR